MARIAFQSPYSSVAELKSLHGLTLPKPYDWRLLSPALVGSINALPGTQGIAVATNGILVAVLQQDKIFFGHLDWFVADEQSSSSRDNHPKVSTTKVKKQKQPKIDISEFV